MLYALTPVVVVRSAATLTFLLAVAALWAIDPGAGRILWGVKGLVLAGPSALLLLLTFRPVFHAVHRAIFARYWWFPLLDGVWVGEAHSNWPRIKAMIDAARRERPAFDPMRDALPDGPSPVPVTAEIESGLFDFRITLRITDTRKSETIFVKPSWKRPDPPRLAYIFEQCEDADVEVSDVRTHKGAAVLSYDPRKQTLSGEYWTQRQSTLGLNTAGSLILRRERLV